MRQVVSAVALLAIARPPLRRLGLRRLAPALLLGIVLVGMNFSLYSAVQRIGLGLGVTVEFLGPLGVALLGAGRTSAGAAAARIGCGALALAGVVLITDPLTGARPDPVGLAFGAAAAVLWAAYILLNQRAGALPGVTGTAVASLDRHRADPARARRAAARGADRRPAAGAARRRRHRRPLERAALLDRPARAAAACRGRCSACCRASTRSRRPSSGCWCCTRCSVSCRSAASPRCALANVLAVLATGRRR